MFQIFLNLIKMTIDLSIRKLIKSHYEGGKNGSQIYHLLNKTVKKRTIYNWIKTINRTKSVQQKKIPGRPRSVRSKLFIAKIKRNVLTNKKRKSARKLASENNCSHPTILNIIHEDLALKTYSPICVPALTQAHIDARLRFARWIRKNFTNERCRKIMFSDEKIFTQDGQINSKNDVIYAESRSAANLNGALKPRHKYPFKVMIWIGLTFNGPTQIAVLPPKTSFDSNFYINKCIPIVKRDGLKLIGPDFVFQQDGATSHTSQMTINVLNNEVPCFIRSDQWPANSPDISPLDYFFWNEVASRLKKKNYSNRNKLVGEIKKTINEIPLKSIQDSIDNFRSRIHDLEKNLGRLFLNKHS